MQPRDQRYRLKNVRIRALRHWMSGAGVREDVQLPDVSRLRMTGVMPLNAFREQALSPTLPPAGEYRASAFCLHARTKTVLAFACSLRWLVGAFHKTENKLRRD